MRREHFRLVLREMRSHKFYSVINVLGLAVGMAASILILLWIQHELSFDRMHENAERIHRATIRLAPPGQAVSHTVLTPIPLAPVLEAGVPEITDSVRLLSYFEGALPGAASVSLTDEDEQFRERFYWADASFFRIFSFPLVEGDRERALAEPHSVVLTESTARKYFGDGEAFGRVLRIDSGFSKEVYKVSGVVADPPPNSHIQFDVLASFVSTESIDDQRLQTESWTLLDCYTYFVLPEEADLVAVEADVIRAIEDHLGGSVGDRVAVKLQPLTSIHLHSHLNNEMTVNGDIAFVYTFSAVALFLLLIACVNYMNLATARSATRAREVAMRKVLGARRADLVRQFLGESLFYSLVALVLALALAALFLPALEALLGAELSLAVTPVRLLALAGIVLFVALVAGSYPAFFLSAFEPRKVLAGDLTSGTGGRRFRTALVAFQFVFSVVLIISTLVVLEQTNYMRSYRLGFDEEHIVMVPVRDVTLRDRYRLVKDELEKVPNVVGTTFSAIPLGVEAPQIGTTLEGHDERLMIGSMVVDEGFLEVFDQELVAGRNFAREHESDVTSAFLANEAALRLVGWSPEEALGRTVDWGFAKKGQIVGVIRDFHYQPLKFSVKPLLLHLRPIAYHYLWLRIGSGDLAGTMGDLERTWARLFPDQPFDYTFLDQEMDQLYRADERLGKAFGLFAGLAVLVACLGLLGMISFVAEQRTREIGVRKAIGAKLRDIVLLLTWQFTRVVLVSVAIAIPLAWLLMSSWLRDYAYRIELGPGVFLLGGLLAVLIAWATVSFQATRAAALDPMEALRHE